MKYRIQNANAVIYREKCNFPATPEHSLLVENHTGKLDYQKAACEHGIRTKRVDWITHMFNGIRLQWSDRSVLSVELGRFASFYLHRTLSSPVSAGSSTGNSCLPFSHAPC